MPETIGAQGRLWSGDLHRGCDVMDERKNINGHFYSEHHPGWGGFAEELFHYTSRYYFATEAFLRNLSGDREFKMSGYRAPHLSETQREVMAAVLAQPPDVRGALGAISIVKSVQDHSPEVDPEVANDYLQRRMSAHPVTNSAAGPPARQRGHACSSPLDPFLSLAERLQMPVAVCEHHIELSLHQLAEQLDAANSTIRSNLQEAIIQLHNAGYTIKNHPRLTHAEAHMIADEDAV